MVQKFKYVAPAGTSGFLPSLLLKIPSLVLVVYCCNQNGIDEDEQIKGIRLSVIFDHIA
jgi:hypothetical protein